ncbi:hypothetical protein JHW43_001056 [Diplocarpon mali]|nr:hypothetical protein JHW43_001056 [Diplocarpon mali]
MPTSTNLHRGEPTLAPRGRDCSEANPAEVRVCERTMDARWDESMVKSDGQVVRERGCIPRTGWHRLKGWLVPTARLCWRASRRRRDQHLAAPEPQPPRSPPAGVARVALVRNGSEAWDRPRFPPPSAAFDSCAPGRPTPGLSPRASSITS